MSLEWVMPKRKDIRTRQEYSEECMKISNEDIKNGGTGLFHFVSFETYMSYDYTINSNKNIKL